MSQTKTVTPEQLREAIAYTNPHDLAMLLTGPNSGNLVFWANSGATGPSAAISGENFLFEDSATQPMPAPPSSVNGEAENELIAGTYLPTAYNDVPVNFAAPAPASPNLASPTGSATFGAQFNGSNPNGYWSFYIIDDTAGGSSGSVGQRCINFTETQPVIAASVTNSPNIFTQGDASDTFTISITNNGPGSTDSSLTVTDTLPVGMTAISMAGSSPNTGWNCNVGTLTCTRTTPLPAGASDPITLTVSVGYNTATGTGAVTDLATVSAGGTAGTSAGDPTTVNPGLVLVSFSTSVAGASYIVDSTTYTTPQTLSLANGSQHTISTTSPQGSNGTQYAFATWSDGGAISHTITINGASGPTSFTATFSTSYLLTTAASPAAGGTVSPVSGTYYASGAVVPLTATANAGYNFSSWTGAVASSSNASTSITMSEPQSVTANFAVSNVAVAINTLPAGLLVSVDGGTAQASPVAVSWQIGSQHTIATISPQGTNGSQYTFANWSDGGALSHSVTASSNTTSYTASFNTSYLLTTSASPAIDGTVTPLSGTYYPAGTIVPLTATANAGYSFSNWTGAVSGTSSESTSVTMSAPQTVTANFVTAPLGLLVSIDGGAAQPSPVAASWQVGSQHTIATSSPQGPNGTQYTWSAWSDGGAISHTVTASVSTTSYTASFNTSYLLTTSANPAGDGLVSPISGTYYPAGTVVSLLATPASVSYIFSGWTGNVASAASPSTTVTMNAPQTLVANFKQNLIQITVGTNVPGPNFSVDGVSYTTPAVLSWIAGSTHTIATTSPQTMSGSQFTFQKWSDGGTISHQVSPTTATSYTATFVVGYQLTLGVTPSGSGSVSPTSGTFYAAGTVVKISATTNPGYIFQHWTGSVANANSTSTTVTMSSPETVTAAFSEGRTELGALLVEATGPLSATKWTFAVGNLGPGAANDAEISSFTLTQTAGVKCAPTIVTAMPDVIGNLAPLGVTATPVTINFTGCAANTRFLLNLKLSANAGSATGSLSLSGLVP